MLRIFYARNDLFMLAGPHYFEYVYFSVLKDPVVSISGSADQLKREAVKARKLADNAFAEAEKQGLLEVAASLDREAAAMERALALRSAKASAGFRSIGTDQTITVRPHD